MQTVIAPALITGVTRITRPFAYLPEYDPAIHTVITPPEPPEPMGLVGLIILGVGALALML